MSAIACHHTRHNEAGHREQALHVGINHTIPIGAVALVPGIGQAGLAVNGHRHVVPGLGPAVGDWKHSGGVIYASEIDTPAEPLGRLVAVDVCHEVVNGRIKQRECGLGCVCREGDLDAVHDGIVTGATADCG